MIDTSQTEIRKLTEIIQRERRLAASVIDAALDLRAVSGDPGALLLAAARALDRAITNYYREVPNGY